MTTAPAAHSRTTDWDLVLDALELELAQGAELVAQLQSSDETDAPLQMLNAWQPPANLDAMSRAQRERAQSLLAALNEQEHVLQTTITATMNELQHVARQFGPHRSRSALVTNTGSFEARA